MLINIIIQFTSIFMLVKYTKSSSVTLESQCISKSSSPWTELSSSDCNSVSTNCCYINVQYSHPDAGSIKSSYCVVLNKKIDDFKESLKARIYMDIVRSARRNMAYKEKYTYIGGNYINNTLNEGERWFNNKTFWCPMNCSQPNASTYACDEKLDEKEVNIERVLSPISEMLLKELKEYYYDDTLSCVDYDPNEMICKSNDLSQYKQMIDSINFQYNITKCNMYGVDECSAEVLNNISFSDENYIGNKEKPKINVEFSFKECIPFPKDFINIEVVCPVGFVFSEYLSVFYYGIGMFVVLIMITG